MQKLTDADYRTLSDFRYALRRFLAFSEAAARSIGLTPQQHQALLAIKGHAGPTPITVKQLAERLLLQPNSTLELTDRLEAAGLIVRTQSTEDRRRVLLTPTEKADELIQALNANYKAEYLRIMPELAETVTELLASVQRRAGEI